MTEFINELKKVKNKLFKCSDSTCNQYVTIELIEALIEGNQRLIKQINSMEQKLEEHKREGHRSRRL